MLGQAQHEGIATGLILSLSKDEQPYGSSTMSQ
jgi:hypothetical protein